MGHGGVGGQGAPVVADDDGVVPAPERLVERAGVTGQGADLVAAVGGDGRGGVAPQERCDGVEAGSGQLWEQESPAMGGVGKAVEAQSQGPVGRALFEVGELHAVRRHAPLFHGDLPYRPW